MPTAFSQPCHGEAETVKVDIQWQEVQECEHCKSRSANQGCCPAAIDQSVALEALLYWEQSTFAFRSEAFLEFISSLDPPPPKQSA